MLVGRHKWQEDGRANDSAKQTKNRNSACLVQNQLQRFLFFFVAFLSLHVYIFFQLINYVTSELGYTMC